MANLLSRSGLSFLRGVRGTGFNPCGPEGLKAGDGTRTRDPWLGKLMLYQLSDSRGCRDCSPAIMELPKSEQARQGDPMPNTELHETAAALVAEGKGILAADESTGTIKKRFDTIGVESTEENRRAYRNLLFTTPGAEEYISGVILYDETIRQQADDGTPFPELLASKGIIPGIKVDQGAKPLAHAEGETITEGLDGLRERLEEYRGLGARFAKWRAVISIGRDIPSEYCIWTNAHALARYAALSQEEGLVPIVEPEVLMDGEHTIERSFHETSRTQHAVFTELRDQRVQPEGILLKPNMVLPGYSSTDQVSDEEIAHETLRS